MNDKAFIDTNIWVYAHSNVQIIQISTLQQAHKIKLKYGFSYWDSLIVASALETNCEQLYSEDMQHKQVIEGRLTILNPFQTLLS